MSIAQQHQATKTRIPGFIYDYVAGGVGHETCLQANRQSLDAVKLKPKRFSSADAPDHSCELLGHRYSAPFGVAPIGFGNVIWPHMAESLAEAAGRHNVPFVASTYTLSCPEKINELAGSNAWLQLYIPKCPDIERAVIERAKSIGYPVLVVTVDCPSAAKRSSETRPGFSRLPKVNLGTVLQVAARPSWALNLLRVKKARLGILEPFVPEGSGLQASIRALTQIPVEHVSLERLKKLRERWPGQLVVKGLLAGEDAAKCASLGVDGIVISNHGGREFDAAPSALDVVEEVRSGAGANVAILADGGVISGLDVARMIASGVDLALAGRAFVYGVVGLGAAGADHVMSSFKDHLASTMTRIGCDSITQLPSFLMAGPPARGGRGDRPPDSLTQPPASSARPNPRRRETYGGEFVARAREQDL